MKVSAFFHSLWVAGRAGEDSESPPDAGASLVGAGFKPAPTEAGRNDELSKYRRFGWLGSPAFLVVLLSLFAIAPLFHPLYFWGAHDARHSVYFLVEFDRSIQDGILYPRWAPDFTFGLGYPIFNIYAPLAFYIGEAFHLLGLGFVESVKVVFGLSIVLSGLTMYLFTRDFFGSRGALLASVVYIYVPYRIVDVYVRGALSESLSFAFFPLALWAFRRVALERRSGKLAIAGLSFAGLILANNTVAMLFVPLLAAYCVWTAVVENWGSVRKMVGACAWMGSAGLIGLGLCAIFWLPMVAEYQYVRTDQWTTADYDYRSHFVYLYQLLSPLWGFGVSKAGPGDEMPFQLGVVSVTLAVLGLFLGRMVPPSEAIYDRLGATNDENDRLALTPTLSLQGRGRRRIPSPSEGEGQGEGETSVASAATSAFKAGQRSANERDGEASSTLVSRLPTPFFLAVTLLAVFLMLPMSAGVWELFRLAVFVQFPWRLLAITALSLSFLAGGVVAVAGRGLGGFAALVSLLVAVVLGSYSYLSPQFIEPAEGPVSLGGLMRFQQSSGELVGLTKWNQEKPKESPLMPLYIAGQPITSKVVPESVPSGASAQTVRRTTTLDEVKVKSPVDLQLTFYTQAYPGWRAYVDGKPAESEPTGKLGLISVKVPSGEHDVLLRFEKTVPRLLGELLSGLTLVGMMAFFLWKDWRRKGSR